MILAIISDIHDNLANLEKCLNWCKKNKVAKIICPGDITNSETLNYLSNNFKGEIFLVSGNAELYEESELKLYKNINYGGEFFIFKIENLNIGLCHRPEITNKIMASAKIKLDFIFHGHTHQPWLKNKGATIIVNPGNLAGEFNEATFAFLDTASRKLELKVLAEL
ncbi:MAG: metallophosphoesterase family protein [Patescibacteria group bacterium]